MIRLRSLPKSIKVLTFSVLVEIITLAVFSLYFVVKFLRYDEDKTKLNFINIVLYFIIIFWMLLALRAIFNKELWGRSSIFFIQLIFVPISYTIFQGTASIILLIIFVFLHVTIFVGLFHKTTFNYLESDH